MSDDWQGWYSKTEPSLSEGSATPNQQNAWPEQPPARALPGEPGGPGEPGEPAWPGRTGGSGSGRRWRFWGQPGRHGRRIALILGIVVVVIIGAIGASYFWINGKINRDVTLPATTLTSAGTNWLIAGSDGRDGLTNAEIVQYHVGFDFGTANSDSLMLLHIGSGRPVLISIPRDSYVDIPGHGYDKINAALGIGGPTLLIQTVESVTGLRINHYMGIGFLGLADVVDKVGGVTMCLPNSLDDSQYSGLTLAAGCHNLDGAQALAFVRDRHSFATEDLQRIQDQRAFLAALLKKATSPGVYLNPFTALPFASTSATAISADKGTSLLDLISAARALRNPVTGTVPIANPNYETQAGDAVEWNQTQATQLFNDLKTDATIPSSLLSGTSLG
jgi:LCP family protein required for cell wall assembly